MKYFTVFVIFMMGGAAMGNLLDADYIGVFTAVCFAFGLSLFIFGETE